MEYKVNLPKEEFTVLEFVQNDFKGIAIINTGLQEFEPKVVFSWHLSMMLQLKNCNEHRLPIKSEIKVLNELEDFLEMTVNGNIAKKPNAIFLARVTWNFTSELIWRVHDVDYVHTELQEILKTKNYPRPFDFRIDNDEEWNMTKWHLKNV